MGTANLGDSANVDCVIPASGVFVIPTNPRRAAVTIISAAAAAITVFIAEMTSSNSGGNVINVGDRPLLIHQFFHGSAVCMQHTIVGTPGDVFTYIETLCDQY